MLLSHQGLLSPVISSTGHPQSSRGCDPKQSGVTLNWIFLPEWGPVNLLSCTPTWATAPKLHLHKKSIFCSRKMFSAQKTFQWSSMIVLQQTCLVTARWYQSCRWETRSTREGNKSSKRIKEVLAGIPKAFPASSPSAHAHTRGQTGPADSSSPTACELLLAEK